MIKLESRFFKTREDLCDWVNQRRAEAATKDDVPNVKIVDIVGSSFGFTLFYEEDN